MGQVRWKIGRQLIMGLLLAVTVSGCGLTVKQKAALNSFSAATQEFSTGAQTEFQKNRQDVIEMNRARFELGDSRVKLMEFDRLLTRDRVQARVTALQTLEDYAGLLHRSPKTLANLFASCGQPSPLNIIHDRVNAEARRLLLYTPKSAKEIAYLLGYEDTAAFSRFFAKMNGESITGFRQREKRE